MGCLPTTTARTTATATTTQAPTERLVSLSQAASPGVVGLAGITPSLVALVHSVRSPPLWGRDNAICVQMAQTSGSKLDYCRSWSRYVLAMAS